MLDAVTVQHPPGGWGMGGVTTAACSLPLSIFYMTYCLAKLGNLVNSLIAQTIHYTPSVKPLVVFLTGAGINLTLTAELSCLCALYAAVRLGVTMTTAGSGSALHACLGAHGIRFT